MLSSNALTNNATGPGSDSFYGARFTNNTGSTLVSFTLAFTGEQWRDGGAATPNAQSLTVGYRVGGALIQDPGFTDIAAPRVYEPNARQHRKRRGNGWKCCSQSHR